MNYWDYMDNMMDNIIEIEEDCIRLNNELYNELYNMIKLNKDLEYKIKLLDNDKSKIYFNIDLLITNNNYKYGISIENKNNNSKIIDTLLFRWNKNLDISKSYYIFYKDAGYNNEKSFNDINNLINEIIRISDFLKNNIVNEKDITDLSGENIINEDKDEDEDEDEDAYKEYSSQKSVCQNVFKFFNFLQF
jgi:hypothetical protein